MIVVGLGNSLLSDDGVGLAVAARLQATLPPDSELTEEMENIKLYHLEEYLFETVSAAFRETGNLSAFDFFCIVIWKANRAKSKVASKLLSKDRKARRDLDMIVQDLGFELY